MFNLVFFFLIICLTLLDIWSRDSCPELTDEFIPIKICQKLFSIGQKLQFLLYDNPMVLIVQFGLTTP